MGIRTPDPFRATEVLYQLSYIPNLVCFCQMPVRLWRKLTTLMLIYNN